MRLWLEPEMGILMMEGVVVTPGEKGADRKPDASLARRETPAQDGDGGAVSDEEVVLDLCAVLEPKAPARPRFCLEGLDPSGAVRGNHIRRVCLGGGGEASHRGLGPGGKTIDEKDAAGG